MRLIDADALKYRKKDYGSYDDVGDDERKRGILFLLKEDIAAAPTVDPVKRGKWIPVNERAAKCSLCGEWEYTNGKDKTGTAIIHRAIKHYCSNCGARMDGEE